MYEIKHDVEEGLFINGEKCTKDALAQCSSNTGNILVTYDNSSVRVISPETISSNSDSDVIVLGNGMEKKESEFAMNLKGLRTPSPREIVSQWLAASPTCKTLENTSTIIVERNVEDKVENTPRLTTSTFEIFDLGTNRLNKTPPSQTPSGLRISPNPMSPETHRKQELCSYLRLMNMNSKSDKQRTKIRSNFNRRSNRVKNLIVQIEKRKLEERINKEIKLNSSESTQFIHEIIKLRRKSMLNSQTTTEPANDIQSSEAAAILQGFTPSLLPIKVRKRKVAFDIVMRRFITDESISVKETKRASININDGLLDTTLSKLKENCNQNEIHNSPTKRLKDTSNKIKNNSAKSTMNANNINAYISPTRSKLNISNPKVGKKHKFDDAISALKWGRRKIKDAAVIFDQIKRNKSTKFRSSFADDERSDIAIKSRLNTTKENNQKIKKSFKDKGKSSAKIVKLKTTKTEKLKTHNHERRVKRRIPMTLFEKEIVKIARLSRLNGRSKVHNLRIYKERLKHKENLPDKKNTEKIEKPNPLVQNVLQTKQGRPIEHKNNGVNNGSKINHDYKNVSKIAVNKKVEIKEDNSSKKIENRLQLQLFNDKQVEIVDLSAISMKGNNIPTEVIPTSPSIKEPMTSLIIVKPQTPIKINSFVKSIELTGIEENCDYLKDHTYAQYTSELSENNQTNDDVDNKLPNFRGFNSEEQNSSNRVLTIASKEFLLVNENSRGAYSKKNDSSIENTTKDLSTALENEDGRTERDKTNSIGKSEDAASEEICMSPLEVEENTIVESEDSNIENQVAEKTDVTENAVIHYNMHDYHVPPKTLNQVSDISNDSSSSSDARSSDSSSIYSEISAKSSHSETTIAEPPEELFFKEKEIEKPIGIIAPKVTTPVQPQFHPDKIIVIQTEPPLDFSGRIPPRPATPPTYIPFVAQNKTPSKTLHRNLVATNRRKILQAQLASPSNSQVDTMSSRNPSSSHCAMLSQVSGRLLHAEYYAGQLVASQERLITCWAQTPLGHILHSQELWIAKGVVARQQFGEDSVLKDMKSRIMIVDNVVSYVEIWIKEHKSVFRERPVADVFAVLYLWKPNQPVEKKLIQLENIKGSADDVQCIILKKSRSVLVSFTIMQSAIKQTTVLHLYQLSPDYQRVQTVIELKSIGTKIQSLHTIEDSDDLVIGCGENCINIWNVEHGYIVATLDMPDTLPEPKCLWTLCNQGFVFLLQECNDGLLRLIAINGIKMKITWKNLKIFNPPQTYYNLRGVCLENGILVSCYENGMLSWNVQTSELLTEEPLPVEDGTPFSSPCCFLSDSHLIQLERNGQIQVRHVLYHLLTSSDLSM